MIPCYCVILKTPTGKGEFEYRVLALLEDEFRELCGPLPQVARLLRQHNLPCPALTRPAAMGRAVHWATAMSNDNRMDMRGIETVALPHRYDQLLAAVA